MVKKLVIILLFIFLSFAININASESELFFKQGEYVDLKIPCISNATQCNNNTLCNITTNYPNGSNYINNKRMSYKGTYYNYTLQNTNNTGQYSNTIFCSDNTKNGYSSFFFTINNIGQVDNTDILGVIIFFACMITLFIVLTIFFYYMDNVMAPGFLSLTFVFTTAALFVVWQYSQQVTFVFSGVVYAVYFSSLILTIFITLLTIVNYIIMSVSYWHTKKEKDRQRIPF